MRAVTAAEMQAIDRLAIESFGLPGRVLMENAGREAVRVLRRRFAAALRRGAAILAGRGNNGGDGFVIARGLAQAGLPVTVYITAPAERLAGDAAANFALLAALGIPVVPLTDEQALAARGPEIAACGVIVDALLGTGLNAEVRGFLGRLIEFVNAAGRPVFSVDIPSGLSADTGRPLGACIRATVTATFAFPKIGCLIHPGPEYTGRLEVVDIGIPGPVAARIPPRQTLLDAAEVRPLIPRRAPDSHKGRHGHVLVVGASPGKTGAAVMTAVAALRAGAGLVTLATARSLNPVAAAAAMETMTALLPEEAPGILGPASREAIRELALGMSVLALGPGLGRAEATTALVRELVPASPVPLVIDADGLNALAGRLEILRGLAVPAVLTPHPGEMARLTGASVAAIQADRLGHARRLAAECRAHVVLKGAATIVAHPDGTAAVNPTGNPGMGAGGMGDVLTGVIAALIAQGLAPGAAARAGVYLHGAAADRVAAAVGPRGYLAGEVMAALPATLADLLREPEA